MKSKVWTIVALLVVISTLAAGCVVPTPVVVEKEVVVTATPTPEPEVVEITVWAEWSPGHLVNKYEAWVEIIEAFEKANPGIKVNYQAFSFDEHRTTVKTAVLADEGPDVLNSQIGAEAQDLYFHEGKLIPLEEYALEYGWLDRYTDVSPVKILNGHNPPSELWDGPQIAALCWERGQLAVFYNKDLFDELGLTEPGPMEWDKFEQIAQTCLDAGYQPMLLGNLEKFDAVHHESAWAARGVPAERHLSWMFSQNDCEARFTDPDFVSAMAKLQEFAQKGYFNEDRDGLSYEDHYARFYKGDVCMRLTGDFAMQRYLDEAPFEIGVFQLPQLDPDIEAGVPGWPGWGLAIPTFSKHVDEAVKFIDFVLSPEAARIWFSHGNLSTMKFDATGIDVHPVHAEVQELTAGPISQNVDLACAACWDVQAPNGQIMLAGKMTPEEFAELVDEATMEYARDMGWCK